MTMSGASDSGRRGRLAAFGVGGTIVAIVAVSVLLRPVEPSAGVAEAASAAPVAASPSAAPTLATATAPRYGSMTTVRVTQGFKLASNRFAGSGQSLLVVDLDASADMPSYVVQHWGDLVTGIDPDTTIASVPIHVVDARTEPYDPTCPTDPTDVSVVGALTPFERLVCFRDRDLHFEQVRVEDYAVMAGSPPWLAGVDGVDFDRAIPFDASASVALPAGVWLAVTGHFDDPSCDRVDVRCRESFVVTASRAADAPATEVRGRWATMASSPLGGRSCPASTWTGDEFFVWGGRIAPDPDSGKPLPDAPDGALYDPRSDRWRMVAAAPLGHRDCPLAAWTGDAVVVLGGWSGESRQRSGAAYVPALDAWREIAEPPFLIAEVAWAGSRLVAVGDDGRSATWDEEDDRWTELPSHPAHAGWMTSLLWTGEEVLVFIAVDGVDSATIGYRLRIGEPSWRPMAESTQWALNAGQMVWTGREAMGLSHPDRSDSGRIGSAAYDPATDTWRELPGCSMDAANAVWTGDLVLSYAAAFDPSTGTCLTLPAAPVRAGPESTSGREFFAFGWTGSAYLAWSGGTGSDRIYDADDGVIFTPD